MKLQSILMPASEFDHLEKGDALYGKVHLLVSLRRLFSLHSQRRKMSSS